MLLMVQENVSTENLQVLLTLSSLYLSESCYKYIWNNADEDYRIPVIVDQTLLDNVQYILGEIKY